jgi:hypothetical protein
MRLFLIIFCIIASTSSAFAEPINYDDPSVHQERFVPSKQYIDGYKNNKKNGRSASKRPNDFRNPNYDLEVGVKGGYRTSELKWNIAGGPAGTSPNILSELQWKEINGYQFEPSIEYTQKTGQLKGLNLQASINKSITTSGNNQDSDYDGNNRTLEYSRSNNSSNAGHAEGFSASIGYAFDLSNDRKKNVTRFVALVGYSMQNQKFVQRDGMQTLTDPFQIPPRVQPVGPFPNLRSSYDMELSMPFVGAELSSYFADVHHLKVKARYSQGTYDGTGHWNLRSDFAQPDSFKQDADGSGFMFGAEYGWEFYPRTQLTLSSNYNYFKTDHGKDITYGPSGAISSFTRFNRAEWQSIDYMAGLNYRF